MKMKCIHCSAMNTVTFDSLIFENEDEELFVTYLSLEMSKNSHSKRDHAPEEEE